MNLFNLLKKEQNLKKKCKNCAFYDKASAKYGVCMNDKSNKFIKFVYDTNKKARIMVPKFGTCKHFKIKE